LALVVVVAAELVSVNELFDGEFDVMSVDSSVESETEYSMVTAPSLNKR
jgi:hypothetical protein